MSRIGPNAIIRVAETLTREFGPATNGEILAAAGLGRYAGGLPEEMVDEAEVTRLHRVLRERLGTPRALAIGRQAGLATGDYLLAHRIPRPVQWLLRLLPAALASRILLDAIGRHAWTFAGSGRFTARHGRPLVVSIEGCALCRDAQAEAPVCAYYAATFERLFQALVSVRTIVTETECEACGGAACRFELRW